MSTNGVVSGIRELLPTIRARREQIEQERRLPREIIEPLQRTRVFSSSIPRAIGGLEWEPLRHLQAIELVSSADGSTGWCTMVGLANNIAAGYMDETGAREIFTDPTQPTAGIAAPMGKAVRVEGGVRVSGRWPFASGITHSSWAWAGCLVMENGQPRMTPFGPDILHVFIPARELEVHDTWYVSGLCGTGSHDFSATDVFVPEHRTFRLLDPTGHRPEPLFQMPPMQNFVSALASVGLGIARGAIDEFIDTAQSKVPTFYTDVLADKAVVQVEVARAEVALGAARAFLFDSVEDLWSTVTAGGTPTPRQLALNRAAAANATSVGATVTRTLSTLAGGNAVYSTSSLQRHSRDADAVNHHFTVAAHVWEEAGRVLLGRKPIAPVL